MEDVEIKEHKSKKKDKEKSIYKNKKFIIGFYILILTVTFCVVVSTIGYKWWDNDFSCEELCENLSESTFSGNLSYDSVVIKNAEKFSKNFYEDTYKNISEKYGSITPEMISIIEDVTKNATNEYKETMSEWYWDYYNNYTTNCLASCNEDYEEFLQIQEETGKEVWKDLSFYEKFMILLVVPLLPDSGEELVSVLIPVIAVILILVFGIRHYLKDKK